MEIFIVILGCIFLLVGFAGCVFPALPGPPISLVAVLLLYAHDGAQDNINNNLVIAMAAGTILVVLLDYFLPIWGTKLSGGSSAGKYGSIVGLIAGIFFLPSLIGPIAIIAGPFIGAVAGELIVGKEFSTALRSGFGSFLGFAAGTAAKLLMSGLIAFYFIKWLLA